MTHPLSNSTSDRSPVPGWQIEIGSRLHFGLLAFAGQPYAFGGAGVMVDTPSLTLTARPAASFTTSGVLGERIRNFAARFEYRNSQPLPPVAIACEGNLTEHAGLGCGTQLGLATAKILCHAAGLTDDDLGTLARITDRAKRSAVGCFGFAHGGFLFETGDADRRQLPTLEFQSAIPDDWRFLLVIEKNTQGRHGSSEQAGFQRLQPVPHEVTERLLQLAREEMIPAIENQSAEQFGRAVYEYGCLAGDCYEGVQGGRFANPTCAKIVSTMRSLGIVGVGQSSWGPVIFGLCEDQLQATDLRRELRLRYSEPDFDIHIASPRNRPAELTSLDPASSSELSR